VGILISQNKKVEEPEFVVEKDSGRGQSDDGVKIIIVDVAGAVEKPGVYKLPNNSRTADALISAGGLSAAADREAVSKTINLAQKLTDGSKIYIPSINESNSFNQSNKSNLININFASLLELDSLEGVGPVTAQKIIDNRPYQNISDLVTKKVLGKAMFEKIKDKLSVY
jgi:competence protein ComEA